MDFHLARFMSYREDFDDYTPDETQTLIKYLLTEAILPSFAFPLPLHRSVCCSEANEAVGVKNTLPQCLFGRRSLNTLREEKSSLIRKNTSRVVCMFLFQLITNNRLSMRLKPSIDGWCIVQNVGRLSLS